MTGKRLDIPKLIDDAAGLRELVMRLQDKRSIALDTESDSLFSYYPKVCLIQLSVYVDGIDAADGEVADYLVDPMAIDDMTPLGDLIGHPDREIVMHAADNDLLVLQRDFGISIQRIFDTQLAARILGRDKVGLAAILDDEFGVTSNKQMQRTNWGSRPLKQEQIVYAMKDTHYLLPLRAKFRTELENAGRWEEAQEAFEILVGTDFEDKEPPERSMWQLKETRSVPKESLGVLEALWEWREAEAQRRDMPPFKVMRNNELAVLAERQPTTVQALSNMRGVGGGTVRRYGTQLVAAIEEGQHRPVPDFPEPVSRPEYTLDRKTMALYDKLRAWRTKTADARHVAPEIIAANSILLEVAKREPADLTELQEIREIGPWKAKTYGPDILDIVRKSAKR